MPTLTTKHQPATAEAIRNMKICCEVGAKMGATKDQMAGAVATMIQESNCHNYLQDAGQGSVGVYMQRLGFGWGTYAQCTNVTYACGAFWRPYMSYLKKGEDPITASDHTQRSAYPSAPAQWMSEARSNVAILTGGKDFGDVTLGGFSPTSSKSITRNLPYEFSRGTPDKPENSWDCMGRLAQEVNWERFMRAGALWFVSEKWLSEQPVRFVFALGTRGVVKITFANDSRRDAAEATVTALAKRWSVLPGDVVKMVGQGPADGKWLVSDTRRTLDNDSTEITLKRPAPKLPEPAPQTQTTTVNVGGSALSLTGTANLKGAPGSAATVYQAAQTISDKHYPYVWGGGHSRAGTPDGGTGRDPGIGYDCSGSVVAALAAANLGFSIGGGTATSGTLEGWGSPGGGKYFTVWASAGHVWIQWHGLGAWRFDTSPHACGPDGPAQRTCPRSTSGFVPRHWDGL